LPETFLGPVEQAGAQKILRQGMARTVAFHLRHIRA